ncbi:MAG: L-lactate permease [Gemmatimonadota bacterium]
MRCWRLSRSSVALAAPFLVAAGFQPTAAVTVTLVGHVVGVSFGAIGTPVIPQVAATALTGREIAAATGIYHSVLGWLPLVVMLLLVRRSAPGADPRRPDWGWTVVTFLCFVVPYSFLWRFVGPELPTLAGALFGGVLFLILLSRFGRKDEGAPRQGVPAFSLGPSRGGRRISRSRPRSTRWFAPPERARRTSYTTKRIDAQDEVTRDARSHAPHRCRGLRPVGRD